MADNLIEVSSQSTLDLLLEQNDIVLVDIYGSWCNPCRVLGAALPHIAAQFPTVKFIKINIDANLYPDVTALPTLFLYVQGQRVHSMQGANKDEIIQVLSQFVRSDSSHTQDVVNVPHVRRDPIKEVPPTPKRGTGFVSKPALTSTYKTFSSM